MLYLLVFISTMLGLVCWYYRRHKYDVPTLHHNNHDLNHHILKTKPRFTSPYSLPFWLQNTHIHSYVSFLIRHRQVNFDRENIKMKDGGVVALDWVQDNVNTLTDSSPVLIILLMWTAYNTRSMGLCSAAAKRGFRVVIFNKRGHGDSTLITPKLQVIGDSEDIWHCVEYIHEKYPKAHLFGHGSSAGCGTLLSYVVKSRDKCLLSAGVYVSPSFNVSRTFADMPLIYAQFLLAALKKLVWMHRKVLRSVVNIKAVMLSFDFHALHKNLYSKLYGYEDVDQFMKDYDPLHDQETVNIPSLAIASHDDPVCQTNTVAYDIFLDNNYSARMLVTVPKGGHCGFFEGSFHLESWSDKLSLDYLEAVIEYTGTKQ